MAVNSFICFNKPKDPDLSFFKDFKRSWKNLDTKQLPLFQIYIKVKLANFVIKQIIKLNKKPKDDYMILRSYI